MLNNWPRPRTYKGLNMNDKLPVPAAITNFELQTVSTQIDFLNDKKIYVEIGSKFGGSFITFW